MWFTNGQCIRSTLIDDRTVSTNLFRSLLASELLPFPLRDGRRKEHRSLRTSARSTRLPQKALRICFALLNRQSFRLLEANLGAHSIPAQGGKAELEIRSPSVQYRSATGENSGLNLISLTGPNGHNSIIGL